MGSLKCLKYGSRDCYKDVPTYDIDKIYTIDSGK